MRTLTLLYTIENYHSLSIVVYLLNANYASQLNASEKCVQVTRATQFSRDKMRENVQCVCVCERGAQVQIAQVLRACNHWLICLQGPPHHSHRVTRTEQKIKYHTYQSVLWTVNTHISVASCSHSYSLAFSHSQCIIFSRSFLSVILFLHCASTSVFFTSMQMDCHTLQQSVSHTIFIYFERLLEQQKVRRRKTTKM